MKFLTGAAVGAFFLLPAAAGAQTTATAPASGQPQAQTSAQATAPTVGATIYDSAGVSIGTVEQVTPQAVVVNTGAGRVSLPPTSIGPGPQGLRIALTKAQVDAAAQQAQAGAQQQLQAALTPGASIRGAGGAVVGTVKSADAQTVTMTTDRGDVQLPVSGFGMGPNGPVIGLTSAQLDAAIAAAGGGQAATSTGTTTSADPMTGASGTTTTTTAETTGTADGTAVTGSTTTETRTTTTRQTRRPNR